MRARGVSSGRGGIEEGRIGCGGFVAGLWSVLCSVAEMGRCLGLWGENVGLTWGKVKWFGVCKEVVWLGVCFEVVWGSARCGFGGIPRDGVRCLI